MGWGLAVLGLGLGLGLVVIGGGLGIGKLAATALEGASRQPEVLGQLRTTGIVFAALIEGFVFFAIILAYLLGGEAIKKGDGARPETAPPAATSTNH